MQSSPCYSLELLSELLLVLYGIDPLRIPVVFSQLTLFHVLYTPFPFGLARMSTIVSDLFQSLLDRLLINSRLPCLGLARCVLRLQVLEGHHLARFLRHKRLLLTWLRYVSLRRPSFCDLWLIFWLFFTHSEAHGWLLKVRTRITAPSCCSGFFDQHFLRVSTAHACVKLSVIGLLAGCTAPLVLSF